MREATISFVKSARMKQLGPQCTDFHKILYLRIFRKSVQKTQVPLKSGKITGPSHEKLGTFIIFCSSILRIRNVSDKGCREIKKHALCSVTFSPPENRAACEITWKNMADPDMSETM